MIVPPPPSSLLAKPFVGAGEGSDEFDDGGFVGLERDPVGPLGTPTAALEREKRQKRSLLRPKGKIAAPLGFWLNHAVVGLRQGRGRAQ
jgi:hypothetical protein